ncbi:MAG: hypothetical protein H6713_35160 [Myxococcales bacterium]|nr:hypothetical protein [Myxococcales bacterium]
MHVRKAATLAPRRGRYRLDLGDLYLQAGDIEAARKAFKLAEKLGEVARAREQLARLPPEPGAG